MHEKCLICNLIAVFCNLIAVFDIRFIESSGLTAIGQLGDLLID